MDAEHGESAGGKLEAAHQAGARENVELQAEAHVHVSVVEGHNQCPEEKKVRFEKLALELQTKTCQLMTMKIMFRLNLGVFKA